MLPITQHHNILTSIDITIIIIFVFFTLVLGICLRNVNKTSVQYISAGCNIPAGILGLSIFSTYVSSITFMSNPASSYINNWSGFIFCLSTPFAVIVTLKWVIPYYRKQKAYSCFEPLEIKFGLWARIYASFCFIFSELLRIGIILSLLSLLLIYLTGFPGYAIIIFTCCIVILYTTLGGLKSVIYTNALQAIFIIIGTISCLYIIYSHINLPFNSIIDICITHNKFSLGDFSFNLSQPTFYALLLIGVTLNLQSLCIDQNQVQRYISANSTKAAKQSLYIFMFFYIIISALFFFTGSLLYVYYNTKGVLPHNISNQLIHGNANDILPFFITKDMSYGLAGIFACAILSAAMGTVSSSINSIATIVCEDYYKRFSSNVTEKNKMKVLKASNIVTGCICCLGSLLFLNYQSTLELQWLLAGIFGGGILGLFVLSIITYKIKSSAALTGVIVGILIITYLTFSQIDKIWLSYLSKCELNNLLTPVFGTLAVILIGFLVSYFIANKCKKKNSNKV